MLLVCHTGMMSAWSCQWPLWRECLAGDEPSTEEKLNQERTALSALLDPALPEAGAISRLSDTHKPVYSHVCFRQFELEFCHF